MDQREVFIKMVVLLKGKTIPEGDADARITYAAALLEDGRSEKRLMDNSKAA